MFGLSVLLAYAGETFIASNYSDRYHKPSCKIVDNIGKDERLVFFSKKEAQDAGYSPCKKCHPSFIQSNINSKRTITKFRSAG